MELRSPSTAAVMGEYPTISVHSAKAVDAGAPARQDAEAGVEPSPPEADALEGREGSNPSASGDARGESPVEEEARDEPAADEASTPLVEKDAKSSKSSSSKSRSRSKSASRSKRSGRSGKRTKAPSFSQKMMEKAGIVAVEKKNRSSSKGRSSSKSTTRKTGDRSLSKSATRKKQDAGESGKTLKKVEMKPEEKTGEKKSGRGRTIIKEMSVRARSKSKNRSDSIVDLGEGKVSVNGNTFKKAEKKPDEKKEEESKESGRGRSIIKEMSIRARSKSKNRSNSTADEGESKVEKEPEMKDEKKSGRGRSIVEGISARARSKSKNRSDSIVDLGEGKVSVNGNTFKKAEKKPDEKKEEESKESGRGRSIIKEMSARARSKSKNRSDSIVEKTPVEVTSNKDEKKPEEKVEEEKSMSDKKVSIMDGAKAKLGSFRGKLSSSKLLNRSTKKVDPMSSIGESEVFTGDTAADLKEDVRESLAETAPVADDETSVKSARSTRSVISVFSRRSNKSSGQDVDGPGTHPEVEVTVASIPDAEDAEAEARAVSLIEDAAAGEEQKSADGRAPSPMESIAKIIQEDAEGDSSVVSGMPDPSFDMSVAPSIAESVVKRVNSVLCNAFACIAADIGLAPAEVKAGEPKSVEEDSDVETIQEDVKQPVKGED
ncbi:hypothetical protein THAOC_02061, partial [Thalassiosira oceanica]